MDMPRSELVFKKWSIKIGVYFALAVSLIVSIFYWYVLSGVAEDDNVSLFHRGMLYCSILIGIVAEYFKALSIVNSRKVLWIIFTVISVVTCVGSYSIMNQNRQIKLTKSSDEYAKTSENQDKAEAVRLKTAYAKDYTAQNAIADRKENKRAYKHDKNYPYATYKAVEAEIKQKLADKNAYESASAMSGSAKVELKSGSTGASSNPFLSTVAKYVAKGDDALVIMAFFLVVTIMIEIGAYFFGKLANEVGLYLTLTNQAITNRANLEHFGYTISPITASNTLGQAQGQTLQHEPQQEAPQQVPQPTAKPKEKIKAKAKKNARTSISADTGTSGDNAQRYNALVDSINQGDTKSTLAGIRGFKFDGQGMGRGTANKYKEALKKDGII